MEIIAPLILGYLLGSVPFGLVITNAAGLGDIRQIGSGNIGATNVLRTGRKDLALATLLLDGGKGAIAVAIACLAGWRPEIAGAAAFLGHCFPIWLRFKGGKGVATFMGTLFALHWPAGLFAGATWLAIARVSKYSSLSALTAAAAAPLVFFTMGQVAFAITPISPGCSLAPNRKSALIKRTRPMPALNAQERIDWLQLIRTPNIGPITFHQLVGRHGSAAAALAALPELSTKAGRRRPLIAADRNAAEAELAAADKSGVRIIASCEDAYPALLREIADPPPLIFLRGHSALFEKPAIAIIGARNASGVGRKMARSLAADLGEAGIIVVSGLARGIDGAAHAAALSSGTVAVVAGGVDVIYPPEHDQLTEEIAKAGAVMSECPMGQQPTARDFPKRNRLISGLSRGVVVVEAAARSGTLITARFALEQGREVFAVPGSPLDPRCQGANRLLRDGATLVETAQDILTVLAEQDRGAWEDRRDLFDWIVAEHHDAGEPDPVALAALRREILEILSFTPQHRDEIFREIDAPAGLFADAMLELVLTGAAAEHTGGRFSLATDGE